MSSAGSTGKPRRSLPSTSRARKLWRCMTRTKTIGEDDVMTTQLKRCLSTFDLTLLGIGNMTGSGIYVLIGTVIREKSGPAIFLSFLIAGITAFLNALCYAELGSRIPKAGSAYTYTYVAGGEFIAFVIGWSVILEYVLSVSSVARGWSGTLESMLSSQLTNETSTVNGTSLSSKWFTEQPDLLAFAIVVVFCGLLAMGPKMSVNINSVITIINICVLGVTAVVMYTHPYMGGQDFSSPQQGGFMPFRLAGVIAGAGTCFYSFIGFDAITVSSEEAANPKRDMPIATAIAVSFVTVLFVVCSLGLVLFQPWYLIDTRAAFTSALRWRGMQWGTYAVGIGSMLGISASLFTSLYALPRIVYSMASDGLIPNILSYIHPTTQVPLVALFLFGTMAALLALLLSITTLADFLSIGTLMAYTLVSASVCILRYRNPHLYAQNEDASDFAAMKRADDYEDVNDNNSTTMAIGCGASIEKNVGKLKKYFENVPLLKNVQPGRAPIVALVGMMVFIFCLCLLTLVAGEYIEHGSPPVIGLLVVLILGISVPFVPFVPCLCILLNMILIVKLSIWTWARFVAWTAIGIVIYLSYGIWHSKETCLSETECPLLYYDGKTPKFDEIEEYLQPVPMSMNPPATN